MAETADKQAPLSPLDEEKLAHALISRGLMTRDEYKEFRNSAADRNSKKNADTLLHELQDAGYLTANQAKRALQELPHLLNQQIPGYQLLEKLGQGAMGTVFKAKQLSMDRFVAIKVLKPKLAADANFLDRFQREAVVAAKLSSNNIVQAIDVGSAGTINYFVMEYVEGITIREELEKGVIYPEREAVEVILQVAQALRTAHRRQMVHRDVKPGNIILTDEGIAKLADLGMAREVEDQALSKAERGMTIGTPYYIAPEQIGGRHEVDIRSDIYSLGATMYHMVTGRPPFPGKQVETVLKSHLKKRLTPPDEINPKLSTGVGEVITHMMAKNPKNRYQSPQDIIFDLECLLNDEPPKFAQEFLKSGQLEQLAEGEVDEEDFARRFRETGLPWFWVGVLGILLTISLLGNLIAMMF